MCARSRELITTDESTVITKPVLDAIVVEDGESDRGFSNTPCANESNGFEVLCETNDLLDEVVASETGPERWGR